jgi:hypothetical protein
MEHRFGNSRYLLVEAGEFLSLLHFAASGCNFIIIWLINLNYSGFQSGINDPGSVLKLVGPL